MLSPATAPMHAEMSALLQQLDKPTSMKRCCAQSQCLILTLCKMQDPVWGCAQYDPAQDCLANNLGCFAVCARAFAVAVPAAGSQQAAASSFTSWGADASWNLQALGHGMSLASKSTPW